MDLLASFTRRYMPEPNSGCWLWIGGAQKRTGYGMCDDGTGQITTAHRVSHRLFIGPIPLGFDVDHLCRTRCCVNPAHLEAVTHHTNLLRTDTLPGVNARKLCCKRGHPLSGDNLWYDPQRKTRHCRTCNRLMAKARGQRRTPEQKQAIAAYLKSWKQLNKAKHRSLR